jgi:hypothetical protein
MKINPAVKIGLTVRGTAIEEKRRAICGGGAET